ncbi:hypothetical protein [Gordonia sp. CPCC 205333]|uniref:hypothetical protein n=1 Tax=Gordonia sp. CPCC 205333 TaxID=3140790 RepID=UPI003AF33172
MAGDKLTVFISWTGPLAKDIAPIWRDLVSEISDRTDPFVSAADIEVGSRGLDDLNKMNSTVQDSASSSSPKQSNTHPGSISKPLSKTLDNATVRAPSSTSLLPQKITRPLKRFQGTLLDEVGVGRIFTALAAAVNADGSAYTRRLDKHWDDYKLRFDQAKATHADATPSEKITTDDMIAESSPPPTTLHRHDATNK